MRQLLLTLVVLLLAGPAHARSYYLNRADVMAEVRSDGSMHVREVREVTFSGTYHAFDRMIPVARGVTLENFSLAEDRPYVMSASESPGTFRVYPLQHEVQISWFYRDTDLRPNRTFTLEYDVRGAVQRHGDVAELYWQFIEPKHEWKALNSRVTITLPQLLPASDIRAWAHGPLFGKITKAIGRADLTCNPLPPNEMVEGRIVFPTSVITSSPRQDSVTALPGILRQETAWARRANLKRVQARLGLGLPVIVLVGGIAAWLSLYRRYGREYQEPNPPEYVREPLEGWKPSEVGYLWRWGDVGPRDMTAMLMDLVRRGALRLVIQKEEHPRLGGLLGTALEDEQYVERVRHFAGGVSASEDYFVNHILFFGTSADRVSFDEFRESAKDHPTAAHDRFEHWMKLVKKEWTRPALIEPASNLAMGFGIAIGVLMFLSVFAIAPLLASPVVMLPGFVGFALIPGSMNLRRRNPQAGKALHQWQAFRRYLTDFSRLKEYPAPAIVLWEQYLVFAVTLGVAERVIEQFKALYPRMAAQGQMGTAAFTNWVSGSGNAFTSMESIGSVFSSFSTGFATATSSFSSSSGGGGGFSGGGGGGGGGGSSGAR